MIAVDKILQTKKFDFADVTPFDLSTEPYYIFDLTSNNTELAGLDLNDELVFTEYIFSKLKQNGVSVGIGKYNENRTIYQRSDVFGGEESRSIHLGIDIWARAGTPVYAPLDGIVHSFADNSQHGDYGPTIILQHELDGVSFYTLYGHLSRISLNGLSVKDEIRKGQQIALFGDYHENVHWPPHLHFQLIKDMQGRNGDFPGVAKESEKEFWLSQCPDPNLILNIKNL